MMTKPKPSLSFRLIMTSLGCVFEIPSEVAPALPMPALGAWGVLVLLPYVKSLRGELCCVETEPGLRPFSGQDSPVERRREESEQRYVWEPFPNVQINVKGIKLYVCTNKVNLKELLALNLTYLNLVWSEFLKVEWTAQLEDKRKKLSKADEKDLQVTSWTKKKNLLGNLCQNWWNYEQRKVLSALNHLESI